MASLHRKKVNILHRGILAWYRRHKRDLHWRRTVDPYEILVSEIMLQQTQVSRVQQKLPLFLREFPTVSTLANASRARVLRAWRGMGYNNRAVRLRELASEITNNHGGLIPSDTEQLKRLRGIGPYTAHAVACFAFEKRVPVVDVNVRRVLSRIFHRSAGVGNILNERQAWKIAGEILPRNANAWNQALMDLGSVICTSRRPCCSLCPAQNFCASRHLETSSVDIKRRKRTKVEPMFDGVPRRIWRGRIIEALRDADRRRPMSVQRLGMMIKPNMSPDDFAWISGILAHLEADGLVERSKKFVRLSER